MTHSIKVLVFKIQPSKINQCFNANIINYKVIIIIKNSYTSWHFTILHIFKDFYKWLFFFKFVKLATSTFNVVG